jgi:hypothetical protein
LTDFTNFRLVRLVGSRSDYRNYDWGDIAASAVAGVFVPGAIGSAVKAFEHSKDLYRHQKRMDFLNKPNRHGQLTHNKHTRDKERRRRDQAMDDLIAVGVDAAYAVTVKQAAKLGTPPLGGGGNCK